PARAHAGLAGVGPRTGVAVVARAPVGLGGVRAGAGRMGAGPRGVRLVLSVADDGVRARAHAGPAGVGLRARVAVGAGAPIGLGGIRARAGRRVAGPRVVTLVQRGADDGVPARAHAAPAGVGLRARVAVAADTPVGLGGVRAGARRRVAGAGLVALVRGRTQRRETAHAGAVLARDGLGASIPVVAGAPLGLGGVRAR